MESSQIIEHKSHTAQNHIAQNHIKEIVIIFIILSIFTLIEVMLASSENISQMVKFFSLAIISCVKVVIIAFWHMHLKDEKAWLKFIAAIPLAIVIYLAVAVLESVYR